MSVNSNSAATALCAIAIGKGNTHNTLNAPKIICKPNKHINNTASPRR